MLVTAGDKNPD